jgi:type VI secretion system protein ImpA
MPFLEVDKLLAPISETEPAGPNLEYDPAFTALEKAAVGKPEQQMGGAIVPGEPPEWNAVSAQAQALLARTKDLRIAARLAEATANRHGIIGFSDALSLVRGLIDHYWAVVHPQLDPDDDNDPTMRFTALSSLSTQSVVAALRTAPLLSSRSLGPINLQEFGIDASGKLESDKADAAKVEAAFVESDLPTLEALLAAILAAQEALGGIDAALQTLAGSQGPDFNGLTRIFFQARQLVEPRVVQRRADERPQDAAGSDGNGGNGAPGGQTEAARASRGDIVSREDVIRALDKICAYYERNEPSSPVPLLLQRCRRLVTLSFVEILKDLAPDSMKQIEMVAGKPPKEE